MPGRRSLRRSSVLPERGRVASSDKIIIKLAGILLTALATE